jgi:secreted trypsin-like serine protease
VTIGEFLCMAINARCPNLLESAGTSWVKTSSQIIGGTAAVQKQFPWQILMIVDRAWWCGGSLIFANWVMTAAHCVVGCVFQNF